MGSKLTNTISSLFIEAPNNLYLTKTSPGIEAGTLHAEVKTDILGNPRNSKTCIGAYEFNEESTFNKTEQNKLLIYPNPAKEYITIDAQSEITIENISVIDITGKRILDKAELNEDGIINISRLKRGVYFIQIQLKKQIITRKLIKE